MKFDENNLNDFSDELLFENFKKTLDEKYFTVLMARHYSPALALARIRLLNKSAAEDMVQETFIRVAKKADSYDSRRPFAPWLYSILKNVCVDFMRKEIRERDGNKSVLENSNDGKGNSPGFRFEELIGDLSENEKEIMICRFIYGLSFTEISSELDLPLETVKKRAQRALKKIRGKMSPAD